MIGRGLRDKRVVVSCVLLMIVVFSLSAATTVPEATVAALYPKIIMGHVYDSMAVPIPGASVSVVSKNGATVVDTQPTTTDSGGLYVVTFDGPKWDIGYTFEATATYDTISNTNSTIADAEAVQYLNVTLSFVIPEFGGLLGSSALALTALFVATVVLVSRRRSGAT